MHEAPTNPVTLRFRSDAEESDFYEYYVESSLPIVRWSLALGLALYAIFGILDATLVPDVIFEALSIRFFVCLIIAGGLLYSFSPHFSKGMQFVMSIIPALTAVGIMIMIWITDELGGTYYYGGLIVILMYIHVLSRLRFVYAATTGWLVVIAFNTVSFAKGHPGFVIMNNSFVLVSAHMFGMFASYMLERYAREVYWQMKALSNRKWELEQTNDELHKALHDLKTMQNQLVHSEKMASLGQLTAGIAHEIKNPLNFINNFACLSEDLASELREALDADLPRDEIEALIDDLSKSATKINEHGRRADGIVRNMLEHARISSGSYHSTDVNRLVEEYVTLAQKEHRGLWPTFEPVIERVYDLSAGEACMAPQDIGRVLLNLLNNAFYAVRQLSQSEAAVYLPTISISTRATGDLVEVRVTDNGPGIPEAIRNRIFEPFFTTKPTGEGTGLGLSLSYDVVTRAHGGSLRVESTEGKGTTFIISLPRASKHTLNRPDLIADSQEKAVPHI